MLYFKTVSTTYAIICQMIRETIRETILRYIKVYLQSGAGIELQVLPGHRPRPYQGLLSCYMHSIMVIRKSSVLASRFG